MLDRLLTRSHESANNAMALAAAVNKGDAGALRLASSTIDLGLVLPHFHEFGLEPISLRREVDAKIAGQHKDLLKLRSGLQRLASRSERLAVDDQRRYFGVGQDIEVIGFRPFRVKGGVAHAERFLLVSRLR
jgi:hypothetical protein